MDRRDKMQILVVDDEKDPDIPIYFETGETQGFLDRWLMKKK